jgi:glutamyl-Q tRNA(Asp) synthetase
MDTGAQDRRTRFAPSPTGPLHLGHAYAALIAASRGTMLLRIEDIDQTRARPEWEAAIHADLAWLGLTYPTPVMRQSDRHAAYDAALDVLWNMGVLYPCTCSRADIRAAASAPQEGAALTGPDGLIYPGTCRSRTRPAQRPPDGALRLDMAATARNVTYTETGLCAGRTHHTAAHLRDAIGDVVLARPAMGVAYHLAVVVDDAAQGITEVTRGSDLAEATPIHVLLQHLLSLPVPDYHHHALVRDATGKRLAKRDDARALSLYRAGGWQAAELRAALLATPCALPLLPPTRPDHS